MKKIRQILFLLILTISIISCIDKKNSDRGEKLIYSNTDTSYIKLYSKYDSFFKQENINIEMVSTNFVWKKRKQFTNPGWWWFYSLIKEKSIQKINNSDYKLVRKVILEVSNPNSNPVSDTLNYRKINWRDTFIANKVEYLNEFIKITRERELLNPIHSLIDYTNGKIQTMYSSKLIGIYNPNELKDCITIGYLEQPFTINIVNPKNNLFGQLSIFSPVTKQKIKLYLYREFDHANEDNYYEYLKLKNIQIVSKEIKNEIENESYDLLRNMQIIDESKYQDTKNYNVIIAFGGLKKIDLNIPVENGKIIVSKINSKDFEYEVEYIE
jgi:hypothetical protein